MVVIRRLLVGALLVGALYFLAFGGEYSWFELRAVRSEVTEEEQELATLRQTLDSLALFIDSLETDSITLERIARERYGLIKPGEVLYRFVEPPDSTSKP